MDKLTPGQRSKVMSAVRGVDTSPELIIRKALHAMGYRFRLHRKDLPGKPDIVLPKYNLCIFVHGCFWHQHPGCKRATVPQTRREYWLEKFKINNQRDSLAKAKLEHLNWRVCVIWECRTKKPYDLKDVLLRCLERN